jgi:tetratricopeptide (TPR) repeat protein
MAVTQNNNKQELAGFHKKCASLKKEGDQLFMKQEHLRAIHTYEKALGLALAGSPERSALLTSQAACWIREKQFSHAILCCTAALEDVPNGKVALKRRATAYEQLGQFKEAQHDLEVAWKQDDTDESVKAMLDKVRGKAKAAAKKKTAVNGLGGSSLEKRPQQYTREQIAAAQAQQQRQRALQAQAQQKIPDLTIRFMREGKDSAEVKVPISVTYTDLVNHAKKSFSLEDDKNIILKWLDLEDEVLTLTSRADLRFALTTFANAEDYKKSQENKKDGANSELPVIELRVFDSEGAVSETKENVQPEELATEDEPAEDVIEIDEWLLSFAALFRRTLGDAAPPKGPLDLREIGLEKCCETLEKAVGSPEAKTLLGAAADKFQEAATAAMFNWGNVHVCAARKIIEVAAEKRRAERDGENKNEENENEDDDYADIKKDLPELDAEFDKAIALFQKALNIKGDFFEASIAWGQQAFERAKIYSNIAKSESDKKEKQKMEKEADKMFDLALQKFDESMKMLSPEQRDVVLVEGSEETSGVKAQILVLWGNVLYERSSVKFLRNDKSWKKDTQSAVAKFNEAACAKGDIVRALQNHISKEWEDEEKAKKEAGAA